jgi:hypothetical protein
MKQYRYKIREDDTFDKMVTAIIVDLLVYKTVTSNIVRKAKEIRDYHDGDIVPDWVTVLCSVDVDKERNPDKLNAVAVLAMGMYCDYYVHQVEAIQNAGIQVCGNHSGRDGDKAVVNFCACAKGLDGPIAKWESTAYAGMDHVVETMERLGFVHVKEEPEMASALIDLLTYLGKESEDDDELPSS